MRTADLDQLVLEVTDTLDELRGHPDSVARCRQRFQDHLASPSQETKEALRVAYESVPTHNRAFVGNMDTKDIPIRMVLYGEQEIESWSHRAAARATGVDPIPSISVPLLDDDDPS